MSGIDNMHGPFKKAVVKQEVFVSLYAKNVDILTN